MTEQTWWSKQCAYRLISMYGYGLLDADDMAQMLAREQRDRYGSDAGKWIAPFAAADDVEMFT